MDAKLTCLSSQGLDYLLEFDQPIYRPRSPHVRFAVSATEGYQHCERKYADAKLLISRVFALCLQKAYFKLRQNERANWYRENVFDNCRLDILPVTCLSMPRKPPQSVQLILGEFPAYRVEGSRSFKLLWLRFYDEQTEKMFRLKFLV